MQCPKCGSTISDSSRECNICFAPLEEAAVLSSPIGLRLPGSQPLAQEAAEEELAPGIPGLDNRAQEPQPNYLAPNAAPSPSPGLSPGGTVRRVALTGEVIETPVAPPALGGPPPAVAPPPGVAPPNTGPLPPARGSYTIPPRRETAPARSNRNVVVAVLLILLLVGGGAFGFWFWQEQRKKSPVGTIDRFMTAFKSKDWDTVTDMIEIPQDSNNPLSALGKDTLKAGLSMSGAFVTIKDYKIGDVTIEGDRARVSVTTTAEISPELAGLAAMGGASAQVPSGTQTITNTVDLRRVNGVWKLDLERAGSMLGGMGGPGGGGTGRAPGRRGGMGAPGGGRAN